jgi:hypothetical protein
MFTLRQSLGALAAIAAAPLAAAIPITTFSRTPITTFSRIGASSNGMDILNFEIHAAMSPGHLTDNTTMSFTVDTHESLITCTGAWAPEGPFPEGEYVSCRSKYVEVTIANECADLLWKQHYGMELQRRYIQGHERLHSAARVRVH